MRTKRLIFMAQAAAIAAIYVVLMISFAPISFGAIQVRFAEALTILPFFTPAAIPGLFIGCLIGNIYGGAALADIIIGSLTTLLAAAISYQLRKKKYLVPLPPIIANALVVPFVLRYAYGVTLPIPFMMLTVGAGELIACGVMGMVILISLEKYRHVIFKMPA